VSDFKGKLHRIRFPIELLPAPAGELTALLPNALAVFKGSACKGREGEIRGVEGKGEGENSGIEQWNSAGEEGAVKSVKPRARKVATPSLQTNRQNISDKNINSCFRDVTYLF